MYIDKFIKNSHTLIAADFSDPFVSLLIIKNGQRSAYRKKIDGKFSVYLMDYLIEVLKDKKLQISQIDRFIVATGPGKLTALRVGLSLIKAIAFGKAIAGISTLPLISLRLKVVEGEHYYPAARLSGKLFCVAGLTMINGKLEYEESQRVVDYSEIKDMINSGKRVVVGNPDGMSEFINKPILAECYTDWTRVLEISGDLWHESSDETLIPNYIVKPRVILKNDYKTV